MINVGIIGYGYWGPNIARNIALLDFVELKKITDLDESAIKKAKKLYPSVEVSKNYLDITNNKDIDLVCIITPVKTHFKIAKSALENGKHIFVEKPFTATVKEAKELIDLADTKGLYIMVDHTYLFTGAVSKIKEIITDKGLGDILYYDSTRVNLGLFQHDVNIIWDLGPHDFSIMDYVIKENPIAVSAHGIAHFKDDIEDIAFVTIYLQNNIIAHFNFNWISPVKVRNVMIGGNNKILLWNDILPDEKIKIYDKGVSIETKESIYKSLIQYRTGDMYAPKIEQEEALKKELGYFVDCIKNNVKPFNDAMTGLKIIQLLEACDKSIKNHGKTVFI